jgi:hypothetical protein
LTGLTAAWGRAIFFRLVIVFILLLVVPTPASIAIVIAVATTPAASVVATTPSSSTSRPPSPTPSVVIISFLLPLFIVAISRWRGAITHSCTLSIQAFTKEKRYLHLNNFIGILSLSRK